MISCLSGLMKYFDNGVDKDSNDKKQTVVMRHQEMSVNQSLRKKVHRRSYNGLFPFSITKSCEKNAEDVSTTYGAMSPNFIFLQFYQSSWFGDDDIPQPLPEEEVCMLPKMLNDHCKTLILSILILVLSLITRPKLELAMTARTKTISRLNFVSASNDLGRVRL